MTDGARTAGRVQPGAGPAGSAEESREPGWFVKLGVIN